MCCSLWLFTSRVLPDIKETKSLILKASDRNLIDLIKKITSLMSRVYISDKINFKKQVL